MFGRKWTEGGRKTRTRVICEYGKGWSAVMDAPEKPEQSGDIRGKYFTFCQLGGVSGGEFCQKIYLSLRSCSFIMVIEISTNEEYYEDKEFITE